MPFKRSNSENKKTYAMSIMTKLGTYHCSLCLSIPILQLCIAKISVIYCANQQDSSNGTKYNKGEKMFLQSKRNCEKAFVNFLFFL